MPEGDDLSSAVPGQTSSGSASHLPWHLISSFEPGTTDLTSYTKRLEFLAGIWPSEYLSQLAPRAALQCKGSAFQKVVRISPEKLKVNDLTGVKLLVSTLGGVWGKTTLEDKYEKFERAIYGISQRSDESNESYMARHEIVFEDVVSQGASLTDMRAYILLRNSALSADDKKRVLVEAKGNLTYEAVTQAIRMLGAKFFQEVQGQQKNHRSKTYDVNYVQEGDEEAFYGDSSEHSFLADGSDLPDMIVEQFLTEGDEDALVVAQFEDALIDTVQNDNEMNVFLSSYVEARRKLTEKSRSRGFWPIRSSYGSKGSGKKGKNKNFFRSRKPLALRIAESDCRLCGQKGHWRAECPKRGQLSSAASVPPKSAVANVMIPASEVSDDDADVFVMEPTGTVMPDVQACVQDSVSNQAENSHSHVCLVSWSHNVRNRHKGWYYKQVCNRLQTVFQNSALPASTRMIPDERSVHRATPSEKTDGKPESDFRSALATSPMKPHVHDQVKASPRVFPATDVSMLHEAMFATAKTFGIVDLGASQTVMGQHQVEEFLDGLPVSVRDRVFEQPVEMMFRFGNNSTVPCKKAIFVPIDKYWIKIAIVDSKTPFLISNNVCRSLGAVIDTCTQSIRFQNLDCEIPLQLSGKKLFLLDFCELAALRPPKTHPMSENAAVPPERVFVCQEQSQPADLHSKSEAGPQVSTSEPPSVAYESQHQSPLPTTAELLCNNHVSSPTIDQNHQKDLQSTYVSNVESNHDYSDHHSLLISAEPGISIHIAVSPRSHGGQQPCRTVQCSADQPNQGRENQPIDDHDLRRGWCTDHPFWGEQTGPDLQAGCDRGSEILPVVHSQVCGEWEGRTSGVPLLPEPMGGTQRAGDGHPRSDETTSKNPRWIGKWETISFSADMHRPGD